MCPACFFLLNIKKKKNTHFGSPKTPNQDNISTSVHLPSPPST